MSSSQSVSLTFCLCRVHSRYADTLHTMEENLHAAGCISKFMDVRALEKFVFSLHCKLRKTDNPLPLCEYQSRCSLYLSREKRRAAQPHGCSRAMGHLCMPSSWCVWMDLSKMSLSVPLNRCPIALTIVWSGPFLHS